MKKIKIAFVLIVFCVLSILGTLVIALPDTAFSNTENRYLQKRPELSAKTLANGSFMSKTDSFLSDQFVGRNALISVGSKIKIAMGQKEINGVYIGKNGYYFEKFTNDSYDNENLDLKIAAYKNYFKAVNLPYTVMLVPTPATILAEYLPPFAAGYNSGAVYNKLNVAFGNATLDLRNTFSQNKENLYYKTDHHWTTPAAYTAYCSFIKAKGETPNEHTFKSVSSSFLGTLHSKVLVGGIKPDEILADTSINAEIKDDAGNTLPLYDTEKLNTKDKYAYFFGGNYGKITVTTGNNNGKNLLVIKDSYANSFLPFLIDHYQSITVLDLRYFGGSAKKVAVQSKATEVLVLYEMSNFLSDNNYYKLVK